MSPTNLPDFSKIIFGDLFDSFGDSPEFKQKLGEYKEPEFDDFDPVEDALDYFEEGELEQAIKAASEGIKVDEENHELYFLRAVGNTLLGNCQEAISDIDKALSLGGKKELLYRLRAFANYKQDKYFSALEDITQAIEANPSKPTNYLIRADFYGKYRYFMKKEIQDLDRAYELLKQEYPAEDSLIQSTKKKMVQGIIGDYASFAAKCGSIGFLAGAGVIYGADVNWGDYTAFQNAMGMISLSCGLYVINQFVNLLRLQRRHLHRFMNYQPDST